MCTCTHTCMCVCVSVWGDKTCVCLCVCSIGLSPCTNSFILSHSLPRQALVGLIRNLALCQDNHQPLRQQTVIPKLWSILTRAYTNCSKRGVPGGPQGLIVSGLRRSTYNYIHFTDVCTEYVKTTTCFSCCPLRLS